MVEITIHASVPTSLDVGVGSPLVTNAETYGGSIPYQPNSGAVPYDPIKLEVGDTLIVRLINDLPYPTGIHWHGIELENYSDGTEVTQNEVPGGVIQPLGNGVQAGGTFLYKFKVPRPGIFWFHPHHHHATNRTFRGQYGMIIVSESAVEDALRLAGTLPPLSQTFPLGLSDITVCKLPGTNDTATYEDPSTVVPASDAAEWLSPNTTFQNGPTPVELCEVPTRLSDDGHQHITTPGMDFKEGEIPNTFSHMLMAGTPPTVEGQTVLTNGVNVGGRKGTPLLQGLQPGPGALDASALKITAEPGSGLRFQIANMATTRYFRLILTTQAGTQIDLIKIGGEGGLLRQAVLEGGSLGIYPTKYEPGEILLPPGSRADVVAVLPTGIQGTVCTLWTRDFQRTGAGWARLPTVPVLHIDVNGPDGTFTFLPGTALKPGLTALPGPTHPGIPFLLPGNFMPPKDGAPNSMTALLNTQDIILTASGTANGINGVNGLAPSKSLLDAMPYTDNPHIDSSRYCQPGDIIEFRVRNESGAHHPFHLHGFSFHPVQLETNLSAVLHNWHPNDVEFRDNFDIPAGHTITFRAEISPRPLADGSTPGGAYGRWLFHCHIFFHAHHGMISELVICDADGSEKPNVNVNGSWAWALVGGTATRTGTYSHPDAGETIVLTESFGGNLTDHGNGTWSWSGTSMALLTDYVYITATDSGNRQDQAVFRVKFAPLDDGSDNGDPHIHTVDGTNYDFQAAGEFVLLRDLEGMEIQTRQTPVLTANPITDPYTGLTTCVSLNTAIAARVGSHRIAYQPDREGRRLQFYVDGKPYQLGDEGIDLDGHRVSTFDAGGGIGLRIDYTHHAVLTVAPHFWNSHGLWYMNVSVAHTHADEGIMGPVPKDSWLPALATGASVGPMPQSLQERYVALYQTFANAWRVTDRTSLFVYEQGTSTATFTDEDWPAEKPPCKLKPHFEIPGAPAPVGMEVEKAELICQGVTLDDLHRDCVFDVATTGDEGFAKGYLLAQDLKLRGSSVHVVGDKAGTRHGESLTLTATVLPISNGRPTPTGSVTFLIDGVAAGAPVKLDAQGRASFTTSELAAGEHRIRAAYASDGGADSYRASSSPNLLHTVAPSSNGATGPNQWWWWWRWWLVLLIIALVLVALIVWSGWLAP